MFQGKQIVYDVIHGLLFLVVGMAHIPYGLRIVVAAALGAFLVDYIMTRGGIPKRQGQRKAAMMAVCAIMLGAVAAVWYGTMGLQPKLYFFAGLAVTLLGLNLIMKQRRTRARQVSPFN